MNKIEDKVIESITLSSKKFEGNSKIKDLEKASEDFKELVKKGIAKERGYNLQSIETSKIKSIGFNVKK